tara:strand:+ start:1245 stop:2504 length:1260 start_codon:yes stop_codon:yes gene_type:complete
MNDIQSTDEVGEGVQIELPLAIAVKNVSPEFYKVVQPNVLINASNSVFKISEHRLYTEVLSIDHRAEPSRLIYSFPYRIFKPHQKKATAKAWTEARTIIRHIQSRVLELPKDYVESVYGKRFNGVTFNPFPKVWYADGYFNVELERDFKKLLAMTRDHFTRGELELLRDLKYEWSHKIYWLIRDKQPWKGVLEIGVNELKELLGIAGKYEKRYDNFKAKVLKPAMLELKGSWAEFGIKEVRGGKGGREVLKIKLMFKTDVRQELRMQKDLRFKFEIDLAGCDIPVSTIHDIRRKIYCEDLIIEDGMIAWDYFYVEQTIDICRNKKGVKDLTKYLFKALYQGTFIKEVEARRKEFNPSRQMGLDDFGEKIKAGNKVYSRTLEEFLKEANEMGMTVDELCKRARYEIIDTPDGKMAVKLDV